MNSVELCHLTFNATFETTSMGPSCVFPTQNSRMSIKPISTGISASQNTIRAATTTILDNPLEPPSPKHRKLFVSCSAITSTSSFGKILEGKLYFAPGRVKQPLQFSLKVFIYFFKHKCDTLVQFDLSCCPGCKGMLTIFTHQHSPHFLASVLKAYLHLRQWCEIKKKSKNAK